MRRLLFWVILVPLGALLVLFAVANRSSVIVSFDPFSGENSALAFSAPLFLVMFAAVIVGVAIGGVASLAHRYRMWKAVRRAEEEAAEHKAKAENERRMREALQPQYPPLSPPS
jgi:uncharacterized integral membrane protein